MLVTRTERRVNAERRLAEIKQKISQTFRAMMEAAEPAEAREHRNALDRLQWERRAAKRALDCARYAERHSDPA